jgi:hypothetical protein
VAGIPALFAIERGARFMQPLSNAEFVVVQRFSQMMSEKIAAVGVDVHVESNFKEFVALRRRLSPTVVLSPCFNPDYSDLTLHNSFWLRAVDSRGETVATIAQRYLDTDSFLDEIRSERLFRDRARTDVHGRFGTIDCAAAAALSGRVGYSGSLWIDPNWRKRNLSGLLDHLSRALLLKNFWFDHITAMIIDRLAVTGIGTKQYGWPHIDGRFEFDFYETNLYNFIFCHMSRAEALTRMRYWLLNPEHNSIESLQKVWELDVHRAEIELIDTTSILGERQDETRIAVR